MMCNSTFSTTTKCAFPIFILNYFSFRSLVAFFFQFSLRESIEKYYRTVDAYTNSSAAREKDAFEMIGKLIGFAVTFIARKYLHQVVNNYRILII